ncbi:uncharacterized protein LOC119412394 [Nematolebias whitei]|uniref:uncharacterized protein LOC119412394 n=1 Tax=Nematolebias whitei TaxID=451745 RepID=UPI0018970C7E|nr:uncharacterized protein LOC119412394 [Nematolebias whitei]
MEVAEYAVPEDGECVIFIRNIAPSEARSLRETLKKIKSVKNYFPLLEKVYIEFETSRDADRLGVWYSLLKRCPAHIVYRMKIPRSTNTALAPRMAAKAMPDLEDLVAGVVAPTTSYGVPKGSAPPFSVTMTTFPFVFPTVSPWFIVPNFLTADTKNRLWLSYVATKHSTVMLTGLPEGNYKHEDVASLVWRYLPEHNLQSLYYNVLVLPLQRRAFVFFDDHESCCRFVEDYIKNPVSLKGTELIVHLVLKEMHPGSCEESMYRSMMKWSNAHVPEPESLPQRLLCVTLSETSVQLIIGIMKAVTKVAPIVSFLPLANRICIEMAASSGVAAVVQKIPCAYKYWNKIRRVESLQSLKQRLQGSSKLRINLDVESQGISFYPPAVKSEPPPPVHGAAEPQEPQTSNEKLQPTAAETVNAPSRSAAFEKRPDASRKVQESAGVPDDGGGAAETKSETAETVNVESKEAEPLELMETSVPQSSAETKLLPTNTSDSPTTAPSTNPPQRPQTTFKTEETSVQPSPEVQKSPHSSDWAAQEPKTTTERSQEQQPPAADSDLVAQKSPSWKVDGKASPAAAEPEPSQPSAAAGSEATVDETTSSAPPVPAPQERTLDFQTIASRIAFSSMETILSEKFLSTDVCLVISNLPEFNDGCYTEADVVHLLRTFGFELEVSRVFVSPQHRMAFVLQPAVKKVQQFFRASNGQDLVLKGSKLQVQVASIQNTSFGFYTFLMSITGCQRKILPSSVVYIKNISSSEATDLKNALRKIGDVINYMPLLNKVFVEFKNPGDADRLGVWYSFLRRRLPHSVHRTGLPEGIKTAECPSLVAQALPDTSNIIARAHIPTTTTGVPEGSVAPFWITMTTSPYVFSTACPWFNIPVHF